MNILRHLLSSSALRSPDEPAAPDPVIDPVDPPAAADPAIDPPAEPAAVDPPVAADPPAPAPAAHGNKGQAPWFQRVIAEVREDKRQSDARAEAAERRAADLAAIVERMQAGGDLAAAAAAGAAPKPAARTAPPEQDFNAAVKAQAAKDRLYEDTMAVRQAGEGEFADFNQSLGVLTAIGATSDDFVSDVLAVDKAGAHKIFDKLAKDPEKAATLVGLDSRRRIAELTRMADAPKTEVKPAAAVIEPKPAAIISRAPAPKPAANPLAPAAAIDPRTAEGNEKMSPEEWNKWYAATYLKRA